MRDRASLFNPRLATLLLGLALLSCAACAEQDFGSPCALPESEVVEAACSPPGDQISASCVVENIIQCDSRVCGVYRGSNGFCTIECTQDTDCPGDAFCDEFVIGTGVSHCVPTALSGR
jgi:hypothetical protein